MSVPTGITDAKDWSEFVVAIGAALVAIAYGMRRVYLMAKNVDEIVTGIKENNAIAKSTRADLASVKDDIARLYASSSEHGHAIRELESWKDHEAGKEDAIKELIHGGEKGVIPV